MNEEKFKDLEEDFKIILREQLEDKLPEYCMMVTEFDDADIQNVTTLKISIITDIDRLDTTENYVKYAKKYYRNAPFDWIKSVLKHHQNLEENGQKSLTGETTFVSSGANRSKLVRTRRDSNPRFLA